MADNLDFRGIVEISVDKSIKDLDRLSDQIRKTQDAFKETGGMKDFEQTLDAIEGRLDGFKQYVDVFQNMSLDQFATFEAALDKGLIDDSNMRRAVAEVVNLRKELGGAHEEALKLNRAFDKSAQDAAYATYAPNIKAAQDLEKQYNKLDNIHFDLYDVDYTFCT